MGKIFRYIKSWLNPGRQEGAYPWATQSLGVSLTSFVPTPTGVIHDMLRLAGVTKGEVVCDLGSGDGRIPIVAARDFGAKAIGIEIRQDLVEEALKKVNEMGLEGRVKIENSDMFDFPLEGIDVVTIFQSDLINKALVSKLKAELKKGARVVSYAYRIPGLTLHKKLNIFDPQGNHTIYLYVV